MRPPLPPGPYLVVGLARSGVGALRMLAPHGEVIGVDSRSPAAVPEGFEVHLRSDGLELLDRVRAVVKSPGVPQEAPVIEAARVRGIEVTGEVELAWRLMPSTRFVAVTGTNGKTTTTELLGAMYGAATAGNVGTALSSLAAGAAPPAADSSPRGEPPAAPGVGPAPRAGTPLSPGGPPAVPGGAAQLPGGLPSAAGGAPQSPTDPPAPSALPLVVCEVSSFQLEDTSRFAPDVAVLVNLGEDHLDRHHTVEAYQAAKLRIFANQTEHDISVAPRGQGVSHSVTFGGRGADLEHRDERLVWRGNDLIRTSEIRLRGAHNLENAMAAAAAALADGVDADTVCHTLSTFAGVPHRLEEVTERDGVLYVNDSKATNVAAATVGIEAFEPGTVHAILGGSIKGGSFAGLRDVLSSTAKAAYLIGEAAPLLEADLEGAVPLQQAGDLATAVALARASAQAGDVILLSPATASYDQYENFERRGEHFRELARG